MLLYNDNQISKEIKQKFESYWKQDNTGAPLMHIVVDNNFNKPKKPLSAYFKNPEDMYTGAENIVKFYQEYQQTHTFKAEAFMDYKANLGPGSLALYIGCQPEFRWESLWYKEISEADWQNIIHQEFTLEAPWIKKHYELIKQIKTLTAGKFFIPIPDIIESVDAMSALRGAQNLCYDFIDYEEEMIDLINKIDKYYLQVYDHFYNLLAPETGGSGYAGFKVWGEGKVAKMQCDFCALMNPYQFKEFVIPSMKLECTHFDKPFYHLDGVDAIKHLPSLLEIANLKAIQWTNGAGKPDGLWDGWYEDIYDKVIDAGKSLYILVENNNPDYCIPGIKKLIDRYGTKALFIRFLDEMSEETANKIIREVGRM
ncbi:hypothetical protein AN639_08780 [Candidatus Epulonipiscium fishelsonii]|uniref:Uncharacterized protein n=1 Tax=Candidatus Epulonipiscium fishelsonii TaxID=77094 RepID=A0ACC8XF30_9FIRM|nr:hypothetical protein AN639_08780 [Epulopiscium sp. SCG-B05WGA-EpuloA1]ONI41957.1 hypothetical protein AN396_02610 [Epulopiscium sp. SCG-B11WGA-EpuloA1]